MTDIKSDVSCENGGVFAQTARISHDSAVLLSSSKPCLTSFVASRSGKIQKAGVCPRQVIVCGTSAARKPRE